MRRLLRANELAKYSTTSAMSRKMSSVKASSMALKGGGILKKDPKAALDIAEEILRVDPASQPGNQLLADAAKALELQDAYLLAFETLCDTHPKDGKAHRALGRAYLEAGMADKAQAAFQKAVDLVPHDGEAIKGVKDASAMGASQKGSWEGKGDFRDSLKSSGEAILLEQAGRVVKSTEAIDNQLAGLFEQYNENQNNLAVVKQIADLCERKNDFESALNYYQWAYHLTNQADPEIEKRIHTIQQMHIDGIIRSKKEEIQAAADEDTRAALQAELDNLLQQQSGGQLESAKARVDRYPNDLQIRFDYGAALFAAGKFKEAVPELQQSLRQPNVRQRAYSLLGQCFWKRNMLDMAVKQFETASAEMVAMDNLKKEVIYNLGCVLEQMGKKNEALAEFKKIYEVDYSYRDVADRVESSYENPPEEPETPADKF